MSLRPLLPLLALTLLGVGCQRPTPTVPVEPPALRCVDLGEGKAGQSFGVLELFVSEGCDACPEPTAHFNALIQAASSKPLVALTWHVDYFNDLVEGQGPCRGAWRDRFSSGLATQRQFAYAKRAGTRPATPQLFGNVATLLEDPSAQGMGLLAGQVLDAKAQLGLKLALNPSLTDLGKGRLGIDFKVDAAGQDTAALRKAHAPQVWVILAEDGLVTTPDRGENCGRRLAHERVVRAFAVATTRTLETGTLELQVPAGVDLTRSRLVGLIQSQHTLEILGGCPGLAFQR